MRFYVVGLFICLSLFARLSVADGYERAQILFPNSDATVMDNNGTVRVTVKITPALRSDNGDYLCLLLDARDVVCGFEQEVELSDVERGTHILELQVRSADGATILSSSPVDFQMWRASRLFPDRKGEGHDTK